MSYGRFEIALKKKVYKWNWP